MDGWCEENIEKEFWVGGRGRGYDARLSHCRLGNCDKHDLLIAVPNLLSLETGAVCFGRIGQGEWCTTESGSI
jgi:hypothetical protein